MTEERKMTQQELEAKLLEKFSKSAEEAVQVLLTLRKPETAYEINRAIDCLRQSLHWVADGYNLITFANNK